MDDKTVENRYRTISNKEIRDNARKLNMTESQMRQAMSEGESVLDNEEILAKILSATKKSRAEMEKESFATLLHFIKMEQEPGEEIPESLKKKWEEPLG